MRLLITGGAGFIGSHLVEHFITGMKYEVHVADRFSYAGKARNLEEVLRGVRVWVGDLADIDFTDKLAAFGFDYVIHAAGSTHVDRAIANPMQFVKDNVMATTNLLWSFKEADRNPDVIPWPRKIVVYSTDEVFGPTPRGDRFDENAPLRPSNPYSSTKMAVEGVCHAYYTTYGLPVTWVRPSNTYGRRQHPEKAIPLFVRQAVSGEALTVHNDGSGARDWLHTSDHARAIEVILDKGVPGTSYNLGAGDEHTDLEVANSIIRLTGSASRVEYVPGRPGHDRRYWMDSSRLRSLGWEPRMTFAAGLSDAVKWNMANPDWWNRDDIVLEPRETTHASCRSA